MSIVSFTSVLPDILMHAPHCPEPTALNAVRRTVIELCQDTLYWKYRADPIDVEEGEIAYDVEVPSGTEPVVVTAVWYKESYVQPVSYAERSRWSLRNLNQMSGPPRAYTALTPAQIELFPIPDASETEVLTIEVAVMPAQTATGADAALMRQWSEGILSGALYRLYSIPNQPFTNPELAQMRYKLYRAESNAAKIAANKAKTMASLSVKPRHP